MNPKPGNIVVYYDGACPKCIRDRENYERLAGKAGENVSWFDITGKDNELRSLGIDPHKALTELHIKDEDENILSELDAYMVLMQRVPLLRPLAWVINLPVIRPFLSRMYHRQVMRRLNRDNRL